MQQNWQALADAVADRRRELGVTQPGLAERSSRLDRQHFPDSEYRNRGLSVRTWSEIERAIDKERRPHTQFLIDATLKWPRGTAHALLYDQELPTGPPAIEEEHPDTLAAIRAEVDSLREEVDEMKRRVRVELAKVQLEVAEMAARVT